ncbi:glycosyltransferase family 2 protein [Acinetobacter haemolyticus]|uniref:glycosyltransferase family 2 protein n=1 Tax=Acinetobacter haemolyticus TaxID=29430 RepID=UPI000AEE38AB|nr:glycosyltransferase family 2 protein [Acinetobacter haemolyticus]QHI27673.1 glycosyltransferase family 2 protein [Acinetobacter haemolyticus]
MFNDYPLISIGIPFYNAEKYLKFAIQSVIAQSYQNWELILVDDGSSDKSLEVAQEFALKDARIRVICDGENKKLPFRLNQIIQQSKGEFVARMDADDIMHPDRLKIQLHFLLEHDYIDLVSTGLISIDDKNKVCGFRGVNNLTTQLSSSFKFPIIHPTIMARKEWYDRNLYSLNYPRAEDFELWCRAYKNNDLKIAILPDLLLFYREFGNITIDKILCSYLDGYKIKNHYEINSKFHNIFQYLLKKTLIQFIGFLGLEQYLARKRNQDLSDQDADKIQRLLNSIVNKYEL